MVEYEKKNKEGWLNIGSMKFDGPVVTGIEFYYLIADLALGSNGRYSFLVYNKRVGVFFLGNFNVLPIFWWGETR